MKSCMFTIIILASFLLCSCDAYNTRVSSTDSLHTSITESSSADTKPIPQNEKIPTNDTLSSDLSSTLQKEYPFLTLDEYIIDRSLTEDKQYNADITVYATGCYAQYSFSASISYIKYDQGWFLNDCSWIIESYKVINWPEESEVDSLLVRRANQVKSYLQSPSYTELSNDGNNTFICKGSINTEYDGYVGISGDVESYWIYNPISGAFDFLVDNTNVSLALTHDIEGSWKDERMSGSLGTYYFIISNQEKNCFTITYTRNDCTDTLYLASSIEEFKETEQLIFMNSNSSHKTKAYIYKTNDGYTLQYYSDYGNTNFNFNMWAYIN